MTAFGLDLPQRGDAAAVVRFCGRAEQLGFTSLWSMENVLPAHPQLAPLPLLAFAAAHTSQARLGVAVFVMPLYNPVLLARELATLDQLSGGRLDVAVGLGRGLPGLEGLGFPSDRPLRRLDEGAQVLRVLWTQERATFRGQVWSFQDRTLEPKPRQQPHPPLWFGVGGPRGLRLAARLADAWIGAGSSSSAEFAERVPRLREELAAVGRDPASFPIAKRVYVSIADRVEGARAALAPTLDEQYTPGTTDRVAVFGPLEHCAEQVRGIIDAGADQIVFNPLHDPEGQLDAVVALRGLLGG